MALVSMTGFAEAHGSRDGAHWRWEAKSVNGRGLDLRLRLPPGFDGIEPAARVLAADRFKRGNIQVVLTHESALGERGLRIDAAALASAVKIAKEVANETGLRQASVDGLLALKGIIVQDESVEMDSRIRAGRDASILESLAAAFDALARARAGEGARLAVVLEGQIAAIARLTAAAAAAAATQPAALRARLTQQIADLMAPGALSPERLEQEIALLAVRADIREELDRLSAHVGEARRLLASGEAVGRKLDFLSQEFNREANTLCSKSSDIALTRIGLDLKAVIDQFREQAQNVE
ncbi:MAG: YicC family protein [Alphaproteobacteria bacterium]|nr:YicC family protein [Alphaproteobacteria bacterium]MDE2162829.1 YicC family protein [Alphaproteobacteria bacterium]MDE2499242.1 YicC family protein [Alphaproteobacteria bacterium]